MALARADYPSSGRVDRMKGPRSPAGPGPFGPPETGPWDLPLHPLSGEAGAVMVSEPDQGRRVRKAGWGAATLAAGGMLLASYLAFVLIPNDLLNYLSLHVAPRARDLIVTVWSIVGFVACGWLFVRLQRREGR